MTISVSANNARVRYTATSSQTAFAIPFEFTDNDEITVFVATTTLVAAVERGQGTGSTEYGISGGGGATGAIAFVTGITQGQIVTIVRDIPIERTTDFTAGTTINRAALNTQLDNITAMIGDLKDKSDRAIRLQPYDSEITLFLPTINNRAGKIFGFDTNGNLTADTSANFDITLDDVVTNTISITGNANSKVNIIAVTDSQITTNGAVLNLKSTKSSNTADIRLDGSSTYGIDLNAGNKAIRLQDATLFSSTVEVSGVSTLASVTTAAINSLSGGDISLKALGNQVNILGIGGQNRITFHNPSAPSMEFFGDSSIIGSGSFLLDIVDGIILDSAAGQILLKDAGVLRMTIGFNGSAQTITSANDLTIASSANGISIKPATSSTDFLSTGGDQTIGVISSAGSAHLKWYQNSNTTLLKVVNPTGTRTLLLPDESGTIHSSGGATTHPNIIVSTDGKVQFRDSAIYIQSGADGHLDLVADTEIQIAATTVNVDGLMDISGNLSVGGNLDVTGTIDFSDSNITNVGSISLDRIASDSAAGINLDSSGPILIDSSNGQALFKQNGATRLTFTHTASGLQTLTAAGIFSITATADINLRPNGGQLYVLNNAGGDNFQFNTGSTPTLSMHQNSNRTNLGLVNPTGTRNILFPDASDTLVGKATTDTLTNKTLTAPTLTGTTVVASFAASGVGTFADGSASAPSITNTGDLDTGIAFPASDSISIATAGTQRLIIDSAGFFDVTAAGNDVARFSGANSGSLVIRNDTANQVIMHTSTSDSLVLGTGGNNDRLTIDANGNVGIGNSSPSAKLDVVTNDNVFAAEFTQSNTSNGDGVSIVVGSTAAADYALTVRSNAGNTSGLAVKADGKVGIGVFSPSARGQLQVHNTTDNGRAAIQLTSNETGAGANNGFAIQVTPNAANGDKDCSLTQFENANMLFHTNNAERMRIAANGSVGIGVSPTHKLHVLTTDSKGFLLDRNTSNSPANLNEYSTHYSLSIKSRAGGSYLNFGGTSAYSSLQATDGASSAAAKVISINPHGGNVGMGNTDPQELLHVASAATTASIRVSGEGNFNKKAQIGYDASAGPNIRSGSSGITTLKFFVDNTSLAMTIAANDVISGDFNDTSDVGLKENITDLETATTKLKQLKPRTFDWKKTDKENGVAGFIAQEVEAVIPKAVIGTNYENSGDAGKAINTTAILAYAIKTIQELEARITALEG